MKKKLKKIKIFLIISSIMWVILFIACVGSKNELATTVMIYILSFTFLINFVVWVVYRIKKKKYTFYTIKTDNETKEIEIKEE